MEVENLRSKIHAETARQRLRAVKEIGKLAPEDARPLLLEGLSHWDRELRKACAGSLARNVGTAAAPLLIEKCSAGDLHILFTLKTLARCQCDEAIAFLGKCVRHSRADIRDAARKALAGYAGEDAAMALIKALPSLQWTGASRTLDKLSRETLLHHVSLLPLAERLVLLDSPKMRTHFRKKQDLGMLCDEVDGPGDLCTTHSENLVF